MATLRTLFLEAEAQGYQEVCVWESNEDDTRLVMAAKGFPYFFVLPRETDPLVFFQELVKTGRKMHAWTMGSFPTSRRITDTYFVAFSNEQDAVFGGMLV